MGYEESRLDYIWNPSVSIDSRPARSLKSGVRDEAWRTQLHFRAKAYSIAIFADTGFAQIALLHTVTLEVSEAPQVCCREVLKALVDAGVLAFHPGPAGKTDSLLNGSSWGILDFDQGERLASFHVFSKPEVLKVAIEDVIQPRF